MPGGIPFTVDTWTPISKKKRHIVLIHALKDHCLQLLDDSLIASIEDNSDSILIEVGGHTYQLLCYTPPGISRLAINLARIPWSTKKKLYLGEIQVHDETRTDTDHEEVYGGDRYSVDSFTTQDDEVPTNISVLRKNGADVPYSEGKTNWVIYTDDDSEDTSSENSSTHPVSNTPISRAREYGSNPYYGFSSSVYSAAAEKASCSRNMHYEILDDDDVPIVPPFFDYAKEIKQQTEKKFPAASEILPSGVKPHTYEYK